MLDDLNDLYYFVQVVDHGGFSQAGRAMNIAKSKLSRRIAMLEQQYNVRLLQRSTRHFSVTEMGREFYERCVAVLVQAEAARDVIGLMQAEPQGIVRMTCPSGLLEYKIRDILIGFLAMYPKIQVHLEATNRRVDVMGERLDLALRSRPLPLEDSSLVMRVLSEGPLRIVASPDFLARYDPIKHPADLSGLPSLCWGPPGDHLWNLVGPHGVEVQVRYHPRFVTTDLTSLRGAALRGIGVVQLPWVVAENDMKAGLLVDVTPGWAPKDFVIHMVFPSRRGLLPSVRLLIDYIVANYKNTNPIS